MKDDRLFRFLRGNRFDRVSFFKALYELAVLEEGRSILSSELKTYTYTGSVFLAEEKPYHYSIRVENASGYEEMKVKNIPLIDLLQVLDFSTDLECAEFMLECKEKTNEN